MEEPPAKMRRVHSSLIPEASTSGVSSNISQIGGGRPQIDESLYSRQLYVLGEDAMRCMAKSNVLIAGLGGLGVEIAKNIILSGVKSVTLLDSKKTTYSDLSSQFYLSEAAVGINRAEACRDSLANLNPHVVVNTLQGKLTENILQNFQVIVLTDSSLEEQFRIGDFAHTKNIPVIVARTFGLFGQIFCDFGENFVVLDTTGEEPTSAAISNISKDSKGLVTTLHEEGHGFEDGDVIQFSYVEGMTELNDGKPYQIKVLGPCMFTIGDTSTFSTYKKGGLATKIKSTKTLHFKTLSASLDSPEYVITDYGKANRPEQLHVAFKALDVFHRQHDRIPQAAEAKDAEIFLKICNALRGDLDLDEELMRKFATACCGNLAPMNSVIGGIAAQEIMKACSGKFHPIFQWLYFDALECLPKKWAPKKRDVAPSQSRYDGQISALGRKLQKKLHKLRYFIVGAGAIGCELLKNFSMMGVGCEKAGGKIVITDMDLIEKSNLHRQFLFRSHDVHQSKALVAAKAVKAMNPDVRVVAHQNRVGSETEQLYNEDFFDRIDGVANALDNVESRIYVDGLCVLYGKPLLESGTLGTKGNTQVVVPYLTESYSSSADPPEKWIPSCTLKHFPNSIEHTLQWARDLFESLFRLEPEIHADYLKNPTFLNKMLRANGITSPPSYQSGAESILENRSETFQECVTWARILWEEQFNLDIDKMLFCLPSDHVDVTGLPFWLPPKKRPYPLFFDINDPLHLDFIVAAANLRAKNFGLRLFPNRDAIALMVNNVIVPLYRFMYLVNVKRPGRFYQWTSSPSSSTWLRPSRAYIKPLEFDKDDNFHMDFVVAASNLRAANYSIPPADRLTSKMIVGRIIPAIVTTTSVVAGLASLELIKIVQGFRNIEVFKNGFINLALPFFTFSQPLAPAKKRRNMIEWTIWDRFEIQGEITLEEFVNYFKDTLGLKILFLAYNVWHFIIMGEANNEKLMPLPMTEALKILSQKDVHSKKRVLVLEVICVDDDGNDFKIPNVRYMLPAN